MFLRKLGTVALVLVASAVPSVAHAEGAACKDGLHRSLISRDGGRLLEAQKLLEQCSAASCSAPVQKACAARRADLEARLASVILSAENRAGVDLVDVTVSIDGKEGPRKLDGRAHDIDPGEHTFVFKLADGQKAERRVSLRDGERNKSVAVTIGGRAAPAAPPAAAAPAAGPSDAALAAAQPRPRSTRPLRLVGFIAGGAGLAGLAVGTAFGLMASRSMSTPHCDASAKVCDPGVIGDAKSAATVSTIGFVAGSVLLAGGLGLVLVTRKETNSARLEAAPTVGLNGGGLSLRGAW